MTSVSLTQHPVYWDECAARSSSLAVAACATRHHMIIVGSGRRQASSDCLETGSGFCGRPVEQDFAATVYCPDLDNPNAHRLRVGAVSGRHMGSDDRPPSALLIRPD
jgi:hypothetical protein